MTRMARRGAPPVRCAVWSWRWSCRWVCGGGLKVWEDGDDAVKRRDVDEVRDAPEREEEASMGAMDDNAAGLAMAQTPVSSSHQAEAQKAS